MTDPETASATDTATASLVSGVFHAGITVSDMEQALCFYRDGLGLEIASDGFTGGPHAQHIWGIPTERVRVVFLSVPGSETMIELFEFEDIERHQASARPCDPGAGHVCLFVDDADRVHKRIVELGFRSRAGEVVEIPAGPHQGAKAAYLIDGDGYHVEVYQRPPA